MVSLSLMNYNEIIYGATLQGWMRIIIRHQKASVHVLEVANLHSISATTTTVNQEIQMKNFHKLLYTWVIHAGMASSVKKNAALVLTLSHGLTHNSLLQQLTQLKWAFAVIKPP